MPPTGPAGEGAGTPWLSLRTVSPHLLEFKPASPKSRGSHMDLSQSCPGYGEPTTHTHPATQVRKQISVLTPPLPHHHPHSEPIISGGDIAFSVSSATSFKQVVIAHNSFLNGLHGFIFVFVFCLAPKTEAEAIYPRHRFSQINPQLKLFYIPPIPQ